MPLKKEYFIAKGTTCDSCSEIIKEQALKVHGVKEAKFNFSTEKGYVIYNDKKTNIKNIFSKIEEENYTCSILDESKKQKTNNPLGLIFLIIGIIIIGYFLFNFIEGIQLPSINQNMGYGLLFIVGILTGFHCISMCGGFIVSYTAKDAQEKRYSHNSHLMYGFGKTLSYTLMGATFGFLGSIIAFTPTMRGVAGILAGIFLVLFGLKMLNIFPILRKIRIKTPKFILKFIGNKSKENPTPLMIGLLNGLMIACGPLQAIYIMAAGTGSIIEGAKLLFVFGVGTLPVMLGFGYIASMVSSKATNRILKASGAIVILLGLVMINNGLVLTGTGYDISSIVGFVTANGNEDVNFEGESIIKEDYQEIRMKVDRSGWSPDKFVLKKGVPVKWIIDGKEITGCNNAIQVPKYGLEFDIESGEQTIEFTPNEEGIVRWSCWMGMIPGTFIVKEDIDISDKEVIQKEINQIPSQPKGSCGGGCGGSCGGSCGCGGAQ